MTVAVPEFTSPAEESSENPLAGLKFKLDGEEFECKGKLSILDVSELAFKSVADGTSEAAEAGAVYQTLAMAFGPEEYPRFKAHCRQHGTSDETILRIIQWLNSAVQANVEAIAGRPTGPSSSSSHGPKDTGGQLVRSISADRSEITVLDGAGPEQVAAARGAAAPAREPKTRQRGGRRTG